MSPGMNSTAGSGALCHRSRADQQLDIQPQHFGAAAKALAAIERGSLILRNTAQRQIAVPCAKNNSDLGRVKWAQLSAVNAFTRCAGRHWQCCSVRQWGCWVA